MDQSKLDELLDIAEQAKAEGDLTTAKAAADKYRSLARGPWHQPGSALYRPEGNPEVGLINPSAGDAARFQSGARGLLTGASRLISGPGQAVTAGAEAVGIASPGATQRYTETVNELERAARGPVTPGATDVPVMAGELGAGLAFPTARAGAVMQGAGRFLSSMWQGLKTGVQAGLPGAMQTFDPSATTPQQVGANVGVGTAVGGGVGTVAAIPGAAANTARGALAGTDPGTAGTMAQVTEAPFAGIQTSVGQQRGTEFARNLESQVAGQGAKEFYNQQAESLRNRFMSIIRDPLAGKDPAAAGVVARKALQNTQASMQSLASRNYEDGFSLAQRQALQSPISVPANFSSTRRLVESFDGKSDELWAQVLRDYPPSQREAINEARARLKQFVAPSPEIAGDRRRAAAIMRTEGYTDEAIAEEMERLYPSPPTPFNLRDMIVMHRQATQIRRVARDAYAAGDTPSPAQQELNRYGGRLVRALEDDLDRLQSSGALEGNPAWQVFNQTRAEYRVAMNARDELEASTISQAFGFTPKDPEAAWDALFNANPNQQIIALKILRNAPEVVEDMKNWQLNKIAEQMVDQSRAATLSKVDVDKLVTGLTRGSEIMGKQFWTPAELARIRSAVGAAQVIMNSIPTPSKTASLNVVSGVMAVSSMSTAFLARLMFQLSGTGLAAPMFFTPEGQRALLELKDAVGKKTAVSARTAAYLTSQLMASEQAAPPEQAPPR